MQDGFSNRLDSFTRSLDTLDLPDHKNIWVDQAPVACPTKIGEARGMVDVDKPLPQFGKTAAGRTMIAAWNAARTIKDAGHAGGGEAPANPTPAPAPTPTP